MRHNDCRGAAHGSTVRFTYSVTGRAARHHRPKRPPIFRHQNRAGLGRILQQNRVFKTLFCVYRCPEVYNAWLATFAPKNTSGVPLYGHAYR